MERRFVASGISGLDEILGGGVLENSITTLSGPTGSGKSTFGVQFLYNGAMELDEPGMYISLEESRSDLLFHMGGYDWNLEQAESERKFILLDYPVHEVDQILSQYGALMEIINSAEIKRVVIDSIMPIALYFKSTEERRTGFMKLIENIRKWGVTTLILSELAVDSETAPRTEYGIETFTDGWINLGTRYDPIKRERLRMVEVMKMKGVAHSTKSFPINIGPTGLSVDTKFDQPKETQIKPSTESKESITQKEIIQKEPAQKVQKEPTQQKKKKPTTKKLAGSSSLASRLAAAKKRILKKN